MVNILNNITTLKLVKKAKRSEYEDDRSECLDKLYKANYPQHSATTCWQIINETQQSFVERCNASPVVYLKSVLTKQRAVLSYAPT